MKKISMNLLLLLLLSLAAFSVTATGTPKTERTLHMFMKAYVAATNSHDFAYVLPLLRSDAIYWFNKSESQGITAIRENFESTWRYLPDEVYGIENIKWLFVDKNSASCVYEYTYQGTHEGSPIKGRGRGTTVLVRQDGQWRITHEHLSIPQ